MANYFYIVGLSGYPTTGEHNLFQTALGIDSNGSGQKRLAEAIGKHYLKDRSSYSILRKYNYLYVMVFEADAEGGGFKLGKKLFRFRYLTKPKLDHEVFLSHFLRAAKGATSPSAAYAVDVDTGRNVSLCYMCGYPDFAHVNEECPESCPDDILFEDA